MAKRPAKPDPKPQEHSAHPEDATPAAGVGGSDPRIESWFSEPENWGWIAGSLDIPCVQHNTIEVSDSGLCSAAGLPSSQPARNEASGAKTQPGSGGIHPLIRAAEAAFRRDQHQLLKEREGQWVAYLGDRRVGYATSKVELYQQCVKLGMKPGEFLVVRIEPDLGDEVMIGPGPLVESPSSMEP